MIKHLARYRYIALAVFLAAVLGVTALLNPGGIDIQIGKFLSGSSPSSSQSVTLTDPEYAQPEELEIIVDTPPNENKAVAVKMLSELATAINGRCHENAGELIVDSHFMTSRSYLADGVSFTVPALEKFPAQPVHKHSDNAYTQSQDDTQYNAAMQTWQQTIIQLKKQVAATCATVQQETYALTAQALPFDNKGADLYGALLESSHHFQNVTGMKKVLVIISSLTNTTTQQSSGPFTLPGVQAIFLGRTCIQSSAAQCEQTASYWKKFLRSTGVSRITDADPEQSAQALSTVV